MAGGVVAGVGKDEAGAALKRGESGAHGVAAGDDVVHEINLSMTEIGERCFEMVLAGRGRRQVAPVAAALGFNGPGATEGLGQLRAGAMSGDVGGQNGVGTSAAVTGRDGDKPAWCGDEGGHFESCGLEVAGRAAWVFDGIGQAACLGLGLAERGLAKRFVCAGG